MVSSKKLSRELRLAYLCHLLYKRLEEGKGGKVAWVRHYRLRVELDKEHAFKFLDNLEKRRVA